MDLEEIRHGIFLEELRKNTKNVSQIRRWPGQNTNKATS
jgi:hypothetical protein